MKSITNLTSRLCRDCKYYIANDRNCCKFGTVDVVSGKESFESARSVRLDAKKFGEDAKQFEINRFKTITVPYYFLLEHWMTLSAFGLSWIYSFSHFLLAFLARLTICRVDISRI